MSKSKNKGKKPALFLFYILVLIACQVLIKHLVPAALHVPCLMPPALLIKEKADFSSAFVVGSLSGSQPASSGAGAAIDL